MFKVKFPKLPNIPLTRTQLTGLIITALLLISIPIGLYLSRKNQIFRSKAQESTNLTEQLLDKKKEYDNPEVSIFSTQNPKEKILNEMINIAKNRQQALKAELKDNPQAFLRDAVLDIQKDQFPQQVQPYLESKITEQGTLRVFHIDYRDHKKDQYLYRLEIDKERSFQLYFTMENPNLRSGGQIYIEGVGIESSVVVKSINSLNNNQISISEDQPSPSSKGEQQAIFIAANFINNANQPISIDRLKNITLSSPTSVNNYYLENSFSQTSFKGDFYGWFTLGQTNKNCSESFPDPDKPYFYRFTFEKWSDEALNKALQNGADLNKYTRQVFVLPADDVCDGILGVGEIGGYNNRPTKSWIFDVSNPSTYAHELGHNLGLGHASAKWCKGVPVSSYDKCIFSEYGDVFDVMGEGELNHFNAPHKLALGWLDANNVIEINKNTHQTFTITPLEKPGAKIIKIPKQNYGEYYFIEYRQPLGFDSRFTGEQTKGVSIRSWYGSSFNTFLFDTSPAPPSSDFSQVAQSFQDPDLGDNESFSDPLNGLTIRQIKHDQNSALVEIEYSNLFGKWKSLNYLPQPAKYNKTFIAKGYLFSVGGLTETVNYDIYSAKIDDQGNIDPWKIVGKVPTTIYTTSAVSDGEYLYILPGHDYDSTSKKSKTTPAYSAKINSDGTLSPFKELGSYFPEFIYSPKAIYFNQHIYIVGGWNFSPSNHVFVAKIDGKGGIEPWQNVASLPKGVFNHTVIVYGDYLYSFGGVAEKNTSLSEVFYTKINSDGKLDEWKNTTNLPKSFTGLSLIPNSNRLLMLGGSDGNSSLYMYPDFYQTTINSNGNLDSWERFDEYVLPKKATSYSVARNDKFMFLVGGETGYYIEPTVYSAPLPYQDPKVCALSITFARNIQTGKCKQFTNACLESDWKKDDTCETSLPTPIGLSYQCLENGTKAKLSWSPLPEQKDSSFYALLRFNHYPVSAWAPATASSGDFSKDLGKDLSYEVSIQPNTENAFSIQTVPVGKISSGAGEQYYDPSLTRSEDLLFTCPAGTTPAPASNNLPSNLSASCSNNSASLTWSGNFDHYQLRVDNLADGWDGTCSGSDFCTDVKANSYLFNASGTNYKYWIHGVDKSGKTTEPVFGTFSCTNDLTVDCNGNGKATANFLQTGQSYLLRVDNLADGWDGTCSSAKGDLCADTSQKSYTFNITSNQQYKVWYHSINNNQSSQALGNNTFSCQN